MLYFIGYVVGVVLSLVMVGVVARHHSGFKKYCEEVDSAFNVRGGSIFIALSVIWPITLVVFSGAGLLMLLSYLCGLFYKNTFNLIVGKPIVYHIDDIFTGL